VYKIISSADTIADSKILSIIPIGTGCFVIMTLVVLKPKKAGGILW